MGIVEINGALQRSACYGHAHTRGKVSAHIIAEVKEQHQEFAVGRSEGEALGIQINYGGACCGERVYCCLKCVQHRRWCRNQRIESVQSYAGYANSRAAQPIAVDELGVVSRDVPGTVSARTLPSQRDTASCRVAPIKAAALDDAQSSGRIRHGATVRANCILRV